MVNVVVGLLLSRSYLKEEKAIHQMLKVCMDVHLHFVMLRNKCSVVSIISGTASFELLVVRSYLHAGSVMTMSVTIQWIGNFIPLIIFYLYYFVVQLNKTFLTIYFQESYNWNDVYELPNSSACWTNLLNTILQWTFNGKILLQLLQIFWWWKVIDLSLNCYS